jgi:hypothetical protein
MHQAVLAATQRASRHQSTHMSRYPGHEGVYGARRLEALALSKDNMRSMSM